MKQIIMAFLTAATVTLSPAAIAAHTNFLQEQIAQNAAAILGLPVQTFELTTLDCSSGKYEGDLYNQQSTTEWLDQAIENNAIILLGDAKHSDRNIREILIAATNYAAWKAPDRNIDTYIEMYSNTGVSDARTWIQDNIAYDKQEYARAANKFIRHITHPPFTNQSFIAVDRRDGNPDWDAAQTYQELARAEAWGKYFKRYLEQTMPLRYEPQSDGAYPTIPTLSFSVEQATEQTFLQSTNWKELYLNQSALLPKYLATASEYAENLSDYALAARTAQNALTYRGGPDAEHYEEKTNTNLKTRLEKDNFLVDRIADHMKAHASGPTPTTVIIAYGSKHIDHIAEMLQKQFPERPLAIAYLTPSTDYEAASRCSPPAPTERWSQRQTYQLVLTGS